MNSKNKQLIAITTLTTLAVSAAALTAIYMVTKKKREKRLAVISNAGYEMAYDVHYPMRYKKGS